MPSTVLPSRTGRALMQGQSAHLVSHVEQSAEVRHEHNRTVSCPGMTLGFPVLGVSDSHCDLDKSGLDCCLIVRAHCGDRDAFHPNARQKHNQEGRQESQTLKPPKCLLGDSLTELRWKGACLRKPPSSSLTCNHGTRRSLSAGLEHTTEFSLWQ